MARIVFLLTCLCMLGCAATSPNKASIPTTELFDDSLFDLQDLPPLESQEQIFVLSDEAKQFVDATLAESVNQDDSVNLLSNAIFDRAHLGLIYDNSATATASETFARGSANCLSMTIMTYSMAKYAGLQTRFLSIDVPEYWTRREGFSLLNGHVNIEIRTEKHVLGSQLAPRAAVIDFDPQEIRQHFRKRAINKRQIMALFYNNLAADALIKHNFDRSYQYLKAATAKDPYLSEAWVNLGVLYRFKGEFSLSELAYQQGLNVDPYNFTAVENLAILYNATGRESQAQKLKDRVFRARKNNPFYHFILGEEARGLGEYEEALTHYKRALRLDDTQHEIYFGMGSALFELGDIARAKLYLGKAARTAPTQEDKTRYRGKLSVLQTQLRPRQAL